ncbi:MAG: hypothetical protein CM1200mP2_40060 [Planctomycetaceae bacterium]|nr:MAG: hypothetical protein CM1200mP2_40060 [Planctomycetaceae bacterium]
MIRDADVVEELLELVDAYRGELSPREVMPPDGDITGKIVHKDKRKREIRVKNEVGREKTVRSSRPHRSSTRMATRSPLMICTRVTGSRSNTTTTTWQPASTN